MNKKLLLSFCVLLSISMTQLAAQNQPAEIVQKQLEAYNKRDIEAFLAVFDENAALYNLGESTPIAEGKTQLRKLYQELFDASPQLYSTVIQRTLFDNKVIDYERIVGRKGATEAIEIIAIYEVVNQKIIKCHFIRKK